MFKRILVCMDGSDHARDALRTAAGIAHRFRACIDLIHVFDPNELLAPSCYAPEIGTALDELMEVVEAEQQRIHRQACAELADAGIPCEAHSLQGHPAECILRTAEEIQADLTVMGCRGISPWHTLVMGSVSNAVVHHAGCPILIVRGNRENFCRVLAACDTSQPSLRAVETAMRIALRFEADCTVINVYEPHRHASPEENARYSAKTLDVMTHQIDALNSEFRMKYNLRHVTGHPVEAIADYSRKQRVDLVVLGHRGLSPFQRMLLGSVSDGVLKHAPCAVLVVR